MNEVATIDGNPRIGSTLRGILGSNVLVARDARDWSQADLADKAGLSTNPIGRLERGEMALRFGNIEKAAAALQLEPTALFSPEPPVAPQPERARVLQRLSVLLTRMDDAELARVGRVIRAVGGVRSDAARLSPLPNVISTCLSCRCNGKRSDKRAVSMSATGIAVFRLHTRKAQ